MSGQTPLVGKVAFELFANARIEGPVVGNHLRDLTGKVVADLVEGRRNVGIGARSLFHAVYVDGVVARCHLQGKHRVRFGTASGIDHTTALALQAELSGAGGGEEIAPERLGGGGLSGCLAQDRNDGADARVTGDVRGLAGGVTENTLAVEPVGDVSRPVRNRSLHRMVGAGGSILPGSDRSSVGDVVDGGMVTVHTVSVQPEFEPGK